MPFGIEIPDKAYFKIGEVARLLAVKPYVLRYWETEFQVLTPPRTRTGHRSYSRADVALLAEIKYLLYKRRFTIEGARKWLRRKSAPDEAEPEPIGKEVLRRIAQQVEELISLVDSR